MKHIVILGGGFAGLAATLRLREHFSPRQAQITLIDRNPYHLFTPSLYEVATSEAPQKNIAIPFTEICDSGVTFHRAAVEKIDPQHRVVYLRDGKTLFYDFLVIALGSQSAYYNIPGLKEHSIAFKTLHDAVRIKNKIQTTCCKEGNCTRKVRVIIGGGGFSGTELAAELLTYKDRLAKQHGLARDCLDITIIQGSEKLLKELNTRVSALAQKRLRRPYVHFAFGGHIKEVTDTEVITDNGHSYPYDILIWTGGVEPNHVAAKSGLPVTKHGQIMVNEYLQVQNFPTIFSAGDVTGFVDPKTHKPAPGVAQVAEDQGKIAGENIYRTLSNRPLKKYHSKHFGYIVPLHGQFAAAELKFGVHFAGMYGWLLQQLVLFRYLLGILPFSKAFRRWNMFEVELEQ